MRFGRCLLLLSLFALPMSGCDFPRLEQRTGPGELDGTHRPQVPALPPAQGSLAPTNARPSGLAPALAPVAPNTTSPTSPPAASSNPNPASNWLKDLKPIPSLTKDEEIPLSDGAWQWVAGNYEDAARLDRPPDSKDAFGFQRDLPIENPLVQRLQHWIDVLHEQLAKENPAMIRIIPKPIVRVHRLRHANANVRPAIICTDLPVTVGSGESQTNRVIRVALALDKEAAQTGFQISTLGETACRPSGDSSDEEAKLVFSRAWGRMLGSGATCRFAVNGGTMAFSPACSPSNATSFSARKVAFGRTLNVITINTGLIDRATTEAEVVGALLHEAAHYYGAHATIGRAEQLTYFYRQTEATAGTRPKPSPALDALGRQAVEAGDAINLRIVPGQIYHSAVAATMQVALANFAKHSTSVPIEKNGSKTLLHTYCDDNEECVQKCGEFAETFADVNFSLDVYNEPYDFSMLSLMRFFWHRPNDQRYRAAELSYRRCAQTIPLKKNREETGLSVSEAMENFGAGLYGRRILLYRPGITLADHADWLSKGYYEAEKIMQAAAAAGLGYHTTEEEADRLSVRFAFLLGIDPRPFSKSHLEALREADSKIDLRSQSYVSYPKCENYRRNGWRENNRPVNLPIGSYLGRHHSSCVRVQTLERAASAAGTHNFPRQDELMPAREWSQFKIRHLQ